MDSANVCANHGSSRVWTRCLKGVLIKSRPLSTTKDIRTGWAIGSLSCPFWIWTGRMYRVYKLSIRIKYYLQCTKWMPVLYEHFLPSCLSLGQMGGWTFIDPLERSSFLSTASSPWGWATPLILMEFHQALCTLLNIQDETPVETPCLWGWISPCPFLEEPSSEDGLPP